MGSLMVERGTGTKGECDIAYYFLRFAEMKWQAAAPPKALIAGEHIVRLLSRHPELSPMGLMSQLQVGDKCREWLKLDTGSKG